MPPQLIIFDYDGVLCNAALFTPDAICEGLREFGRLVGRAIAEPDEATLLGTLGYPSTETYPPLLPDELRPRWREMHRLVLDTMERRIAALGEAVLYPGAARLLDDLCADGRTLALASNSSARYQEAHRRAAGLDRWFSILLHAQSEAIGSKADMVVRIIHRIVARPAVMIGDRASDHDAAAAAAVPFIACAYGYGRPSEWPAAESVVGSIDELRERLGLGSARGV